MDSANPDVQSYLDALGDSIALFLAVRDTVHDGHSGFDEAIKWKNCLTYVKDGENLIQTVLGKNKVSLIFHNGAQLDDPAGLLEGEGSKTRTVRITSDDFDREALAALVAQAVASAD